MPFDSYKEIELKIPQDMYRGLEIIAGLCGESVERHVLRLMGDELRLCIIWRRIDDEIPEGMVPIGDSYMIDKEVYRYLKGGA